MTKKEMKKLADRFHMDILRDPVTREATRLMVESRDRMPDLDIYADDPESLDGVRRTWMGGVGWMYTIEIPHGWVDLWGWTE